MAGDETILPGGAGPQAASEPGPDIAVVVPSHCRPLRLRWLLNALAEQTLPRDRWEVVVGHDSPDDETETLLREHPLAREGVLRHVRLASGSAPPGANRNAALRLVRAPLVLFTDDDCRPPRDWLAHALAAAGRHPGAIVQGMTLPDPDEEAIMHAPHKRTQWVLPPVPWAQACNIIYPRALLEQVGGFDETQFTGEDTDLALRAQQAGAGYVGDRSVLTFHAVYEGSLLGRVRDAWRWRDLPWLVKRHPALRERFFLWIFWKRSHVWLPFALAGWYLARRNLTYGVLAVPYVITSAPMHGMDARGRLRTLVELPGRVLIDGTEMLALTRGSVRFRTLFL